MTKSDLIDVLCEMQKLPKGRAEQLVHIIFDALEAALKKGERIEIRGFGSFELRSYRGYDGRNPRTGSAVSVRPKRLPFFKVGKELKERVNAGRLTAPRASAKRAPAPDGDATQTAVPATKATTTGPVAADASGSTATPPGANRATA
jgi:integration host factor subunit beta